MVKETRETTYRRLFVLIDASGSMYDQREEVVNGVNHLLKALWQEQPEHIKTYMTLSTFNDRSTTLFNGQLSEDDCVLKHNAYKPKGTTALYDTLGPILELMEPETTVLIASDGVDSASTRYTKSQIATLISAAKVDFKTQFLFLAQGEGALECSIELGFDEGSVISVDAAEESLGSFMQKDAFIERTSQMVMGTQEVSEPTEPAPKRAKTQKDSEGAE